MNMPEEHYNPTSAYFWWNRIRGSHPDISLKLDLCMPKTILVDCNFWDALSVLDNKKDKIPWAKLKTAINKIGLPVFIKSDVASAKHDGPRAYMVRNFNELKTVIIHTVDDNACKDLEFAGFMIREFLNLEHRFCAFRGHPIAREFRLFTINGKVVCNHYYWPKEAIQESLNRVKGDEIEGWDWEKDYDVVSRPIPFDEWRVIVHLTELAVSALTPYGNWSIDWAQDRDGKWWLIDMAIANRSWHSESCLFYKDLRK